MIVKIATAGPDPGGLVRYSFGRGNANEHVRQRTIAGTCHTIAEGQVTSEAVEQVAADLRIHQQTWGKQPKGGHVYHVVIALNPGDRPVTDAEWRTICEDYLTARGITDPAKAGVQWTAINHGRNEAGADHVHLIVSRVRADGKTVDTWQDGPRSQAWAQAAEKRYDLTALESRGAGAGIPKLTPGELAKAKRDGREPARRRLADAVRPIAAASTSELDYVQRLREAGLDPRPRIDRTTHKVTGYSVGSPGERFGGGKLGPDLSLPFLRRVAWDNSNGLAAAQEWQHPTPRRPVPPPTAAAVKAALENIEKDLWQAPLMTVDQHRAWSAQAAGLTAAQAAATTDPTAKAALQALSRELGRWTAPTAARPPQVARHAAQLLAAALGGSAGGGERTSPDDGAALEAATSVARIAQMHRASRPAITEDAQVARRAATQQAAVARATVAPGYYHTDTGVIRVQRARAGHTYAATRDPDTGKWRPTKATTLVAAANGSKMTPAQVAAWEKTLTPPTPTPTAVPVQPPAVRPPLRRQPTLRWRR